MQFHGHSLYCRTTDIAISARLRISSAAMEIRVLLCFVMLAFASGQEDCVYKLWSYRAVTNGGACCYKGMCIKHCPTIIGFCYTRVQCNSDQDCIPPPPCSSNCGIADVVIDKTTCDDE